MIVKPSIAFNDFAGSAKGVTARNVKGRNILSSRAQHSKSVTPAQAVSRNRLSSISRSYKKLTDLQMSAWGRLAEKMKGISTFGQATELTAHNAFVRINTNRAMVGMSPLEDAPDYIADVPEVEYEDFWITPERIVFVNIQQPCSSDQKTTMPRYIISTRESHRSYFVNPSFIKIVHRNNAGLIIAELNQDGYESIPISQKYQDQIAKIV